MSFPDIELTCDESYINNLICLRVFAIRYNDIWKMEIHSTDIGTVFSCLGLEKFAILII